MTPLCASTSFTARQSNRRYTHHKPGTPYVPGLFLQVTYNPFYPFNPLTVLKGDHDAPDQDCLYARAGY